MKKFNESLPNERLAALRGATRRLEAVLGSRVEEKAAPVLRRGGGVSKGRGLAAECSEACAAALVRGVRAAQSLAFCSSGCSLDSFAARSSSGEVRTTLRAEGKIGPPRRLAAAAAGGAPAAVAPAGGEGEGEGRARLAGEGKTVAGEKATGEKAAAAAEAAAPAGC